MVVEVVTDPELLSGSFSVVGLRSNILLEEQSPGTYTGRLPVQPGMNGTDLPVTVRLVDRAGNVRLPEPQVGTVSIDTIAPKAYLTVKPPSPSGSGGYYNSGDGAPVVTIVTDTDATVYYTLDDGDRQLYIGPIEMPQGEHTLTYWAVDGAGNESEPATLTARVDTVKPASPDLLGIFDPSGQQQLAPGQPTNLRVVRIEGTAEASARLQFYVNGEFRAQARANADTGEFSADLRLGEGVNTISVTATDAAGNVSDPSQVSISRDTTAPVFQIQLDQEHAVVTVTASEDLNGMPAITVRQGENEQSGSMTAVEGQIQTYSYTYDPVQGADEIVITVSGSDLAGNSGLATYAETVIRSDEDAGVNAESVSVEIEAGTLKQDATLTITPAFIEDFEILFPGLDLVATPYDFHVQPVGGGTPEYAEGKWIKVTFKLNVPEGVAFDPRQIHVYYLDEAEPLTAEYDVATNTVTVYLKHFSSYAVLADTTPPPLEVATPADGILLNSRSVTVTGTTEPGAAVTINGEAAVVDDNGSFTGTAIFGADGPQTITVVAEDAAGLTTTREINVTIDTVPPTIAVTAPDQDTVYTSSRTLTVSATTEAGGLTMVTVDGVEEPLVVTTSGGFSVNVSLAENDTTTIRINATDGAGNPAEEKVITAVNDTVPPEIILDALPPVTGSASITLSGQVDSAVTELRVRVSHEGNMVQEVDVSVGEDLRFSQTIELWEGDNLITIQATDPAGNVGDHFKVGADAEPVSSAVVEYNPNVPKVTITQPGETMYTSAESIVISGTATVGGVGAQGAAAVFKVNSTVQGTVVIGTDGTFSQVVALNGGDGQEVENTIVVEVTGLNGLKGQAVRTVWRDNRSPDLQASVAEITTTSSSTTITVTTEPYATVYINDQAMEQVVGAAGQASYQVTLNMGQNEFRVKARDRAGNESPVVTVTITRTSPPGGGRASTAFKKKAQKQIASGRGGELSSPDGRFKVILPAGAVPEAVNVTVESLERVKMETPSYRMIGKAVEVQASSVATGQQVTSFKDKVTLTLKYTPYDVRGVDVDKLGVYYWNTAAKAWIPVPAVHDMARRTFTAWVDHFTIFAVMADVSTIGAPAIEDLPEEVASNVLTLNGCAEPGSTVKVFVNNASQGSVTAAADGRYSARVTLDPGENIIFAVMTDATSGLVRASQEYVLTYTPGLEAMFNDIASHWARGDIETLVERGVVSGYPDGSFRPEKNTTRAEFTKMLVAALDLEARDGAILSFADEVPDWARSYVATAVEKGLVAGYEDHTFRADAYITRAEIAAVLVRSMKYKEGISSGAVKAVVSFSDESDIPDWAKESVHAAVRYGIVTGYPDGSFGPFRNATRAETAAMIRRFLELE
ncbi:S-layer homology domain-containing protein [Calderihabitans maritimus]|nr:S-layer homology domain-containing protein [Calderihabitans maritimus]